MGERAVNDVDDRISPANSDSEYPPEDTLGDQALRRWEADAKRAWTLAPRCRGEWYDRVSRLAYELYLRRGKDPGRDLEDWFAAERMVLSEIAYHGRESGEESNGKNE
jgi:hypothetical protein